MAIFDKFTKKRRQEPEWKPKKRKAAVKPKQKEKEAELPKKPAATAKKPLNIETAWKVISVPHITEKATDLTANNQYIFRVFKSANKAEIKKAIEDIYGVEVEGVRIINVRPKKRRLGKIEGQRKGYKKAIVKIKKGQEIEVLPR